MAKITYKGKEHDVKLTNGKLLRLEEGGISVLDVSGESSKKPVRYYASLIKEAIESDDTVEEIADGFETLADLSKAAASLLNEVFPAHPTQAVKGAAKKHR